MNLKTLKRQQNLVFRQLNRLGFVQNGTYKRVIDQDYDPALGTDTETYESVEIMVHLTDFNRSELTEQVLATDTKAIILKEEITDFTPQIDDFITVDDIDYAVVSIMNSPDSPTIELQVRGGA